MRLIHGVRRFLAIHRDRAFDGFERHVRRNGQLNHNLPVSPAHRFWSVILFLKKLSRKTVPVRVQPLQQQYTLRESNL